MKDKFLIINADDFGYNGEQNKAISELYGAGLITSTSVMAVANSADEACAFAAASGLPVGVHLTINSDNPENRWKSLSGASSLEDSFGLHCSQKDIALNAKRKDVAVELEAQYRYLTERGCTVDHADNHCATLYGINGRRFYKDAYDFCRRHSLPYRFPKRPDFLERQLGRSVPKPIIMLHSHIVALGEKAGVRMLDDLVSNPYSMSKIESYDALRKYYLDAVDNCCDGITEMFLHPAYPADCGDEWQKRVYELELLKSGDILSRAEQKGVKVVSWQIFSELK